ncbi:MAG TPA: hypothetical protein VK601_14685, partial [Kofleriaceae bacterium]|nr:hypothetical protein [Kofleriaceae bacterium]
EIAQRERRAQLFEIEIHDTPRRATSDSRSGQVFESPEPTGEARRRSAGGAINPPATNASAAHARP